MAGVSIVSCMSDRIPEVEGNWTGVYHVVAMDIDTLGNVDKY